MNMLKFVLCLCAFLAISQARAEEVDLELVLLADASGSIDINEIRFQREGYAEALVHPDVLNAIADGIPAKIAVTFVEWAGPTAQDVVVPWTIIAGRADAETFGAKLVAAPKRAFGRNAIGSAITAAEGLITGNEHEGIRKVIDFSGDSANSWDPMPTEEARASAIAKGITINGLAIRCRGCSGRPIGYDLEKAFRDTIIGGPNSFVVTAQDKSEFKTAVRRKLILEIAGQGPEASPADVRRLVAADEQFVDQPGDREDHN